MAASAAPSVVADNAELTATGLRKRYKGRDVVRDVNLRVARGEVIGLLGPNGAGKTTSFYMIVGLVSPDAGEIELAGRRLAGLPMHRRSQMGIGYLPQEASVFRKLSVANNIRAILQVRKDLDRAGIERELVDLMDELSIGHIADSKGLNLSGGERRRVEIARALAARPTFMLLDEPFAGIDPISIGDIRGIIRHLQNRGIGVLITDHNVRETLSICDRAYILADGTVIAEGQGEHILADQKVRDVYLGEDFRL
ncbi:LPS export ABC transporter ATP-binding protein [Salinisphaera sp. LB1]|uniref:LPS export ABC transporter ATP-binding protein n=1 Tax=Salinisphaera sp. LB1 TaxID=2183911 RepID=UPI000D705FC4|nr:LPS export ABC transporter ATP-binding protein [Salinisphaera sp. LB1]AWN16497.1 Lipopolysaccharide ABC transporter, ATP-binding protein LptB [Salinisphaera sp. LB1]